MPFGWICRSAISAWWSAAMPSAACGRRWAIGYALWHRSFVALQLAKMRVPKLSTIQLPDLEIKMSDIVIASAARTPIGSFNGVFAGLSAHELGKVAIEAALQ